MTEPEQPRAVYRVLEEPCQLCHYADYWHGNMPRCTHDPLPEGLIHTDGPEDFGTCGYWEKRK